MRRAAVLMFVMLSLLWQSHALAASALRLGLEELAGGDTVATAATPAQPFGQAAMTADEADGAVEFLLAEVGSNQAAPARLPCVPPPDGRRCPPRAAPAPAHPSPALDGLLRPPRAA